jgi:molybdopterin molybdotransferase
VRTINDHRRDVTALLAPIASRLGVEVLEVSGAAISADPARYERRVLASELRSPSSLPSFDNSQMDGYAVIAAELAGASGDSPVELLVSARVAAGDPGGEHQAGTATPIMTGAPVPRGADAVVQIERAVPPVFPARVVTGSVDVGTADGRPVDGGTVDVGTADGGTVDGGTADGGTADGGTADGGPADGGRVTVRFVAPVEAGSFVRAAGSDVAAGAVLLPAAAELGPAQYGVVAGTGATEVTVRRRPRVLLVSTGHEIREPGSRLEPGQIYDANTVALTAALQGAGCAVTPIPCRSDDAGDLLALLREHAAGHDALVTVGGVSAGVREVVRDALGPRGVEFMKVAMQPGGPQGFGLLRLGDVGLAPDAVLPTVCLPGNPVSALVSFEAFLRPALRSVLGVARPLREVRRGRVAHPFTSPPNHHQLRRGVVQDDGVLELVGGPSSHLLHSYAGSTVLVHVPVGTAEVREGDELEYWRIDG